jgi:excisionase family DNA binding protein
VNVLSVDATAAKLGCSRRRVFQLLADGTLERAPRYGREIRIFEASVDRALTPTPTKSRKRRAPNNAGTWSRTEFADLLA